MFSTNIGSYICDNTSFFVAVFINLAYNHLYYCVLTIIGLQINNNCQNLIRLVVHLVAFTRMRSANY